MAVDASASLEMQEPDLVGALGGPPEGGEATTIGSPFALFLRTFLENKVATVGLGIVVLLTLFSFIGPLVYHSNQSSSAIGSLVANANLPPSLRYPLGTDQLGFNNLGRLMLGGQSSLEVGFAVAIVTTVFGALYGAVSALAGGIIDAIMMRFVDGLFALPFLIILIVLSDIITPSLFVIILILSSLSWLGTARLVRGEALSQRVREYVQAVQVAGGGQRRIIIRHILPNAIGTIMVNASLAIVGAISALATLNFLGFGLPADYPSWGGALSQGINYIYDGYWWEMWPALALLVLILVGFSLIGDALRDSFETRLQRR
jgi:peptide/nickel transport system permease protein